MRRRNLANIYDLGVKELWSLWRDPMMLVLIVYVFTASVYTKATSMPETLHNAPIAIVDEDNSALSQRVASAFYPPQFTPPAMIDYGDVDPGMDAGLYTFALVIPPNFQRDVLAGRSPAVQLNVDATRMSQAFTGSGHVQQIFTGEVNEFVKRYRSTTAPPVDLALRARFNPALDKAWFGSVVQIINHITLLSIILTGAALIREREHGTIEHLLVMPADLTLRMRFNPNLEHAWFGALMEIINNVTMLSIILTGAALIREREHGTIEHLLVMPVTPGEIMLAQVWSMGLVVALAALAALVFVVQGALHIPVQGSVALFMLVAVLHLFATTSMGIFLATLARSMPQFGMLLVLVLVPLQLLSGGMTPRESMPALVQNLMLAAPTTHFVTAAQAILYRGAGLEVVWPQLLAIGVIGSVLFATALARFRKTLSQMA